MNKNTEQQKLREELREAKARELNATAGYCRSMNFVHRLTNRYNGGWSAAMRCAKHALHGIEWEKVEEAQGRRLFELRVENEELEFGVAEEDIANVDPCIESEDDTEAAREDAGKIVVGMTIMTSSFWIKLPVILMSSWTKQSKLPLPLMPPELCFPYYL